MREQRERAPQPATGEREGEEPQEEFDELDRLFIEHLPRLDPPPEVIQRILALARHSAPPLESNAEQQQPPIRQGKHNSDGAGRRTDG
ncbi:MAG: hypothetical protein IRZ31_06665 [Thermogemmatispora sp.]|uniref:hypothetical protein n=1 Tax=Thermogemmatispora sp. TaxID=1968838 RepID=UPI00262A518D|nr:hypothetical protein [Thermogemmatispora sp.]MBX5456567.1 hypothetical protein [Thermogemmatispora sp.]